MHKLLTILVLSIFFIGCNSNTPTENNFTDDYGRVITVPSQPKRIVSVSPAVTEIICALGGEEYLVGRTDYCTYPTTVSQIESIGGITNFNLEKVISLQPDIVISGSMVSERNTNQLQEMGIPIVCVVEQKNFEGLYENIKKIGILINKEASADSLINALSQSLKNTIGELDTNVHKTAYYAVGYGKGGNFTAGGNTFINDILSISGLSNIASDLEGWEYSLELLMQKNPDYIIIRREDSASFCNMKPYTDLDAVKNGHVIGIESGTIDLQVPRNIDAIKYINQKINQQ